VSESAPDYWSFVEGTAEGIGAAGERIGLPGYESDEDIEAESAAAMAERRRIAAERASAHSERMRSTMKWIALALGGAVAGVFLVWVVK